MPPRGAPAKPAPLKLEFSTTSIRNTSIATENDVHYYEVSTWDWDPFVTKVKRLIPETTTMVLVAEFKRDNEKDKGCTGVRIVDPEKPDKDYQSPESYLGLSSGDSTSLGMFTANGKQYKWQAVKGAIELVPTDEDDSKPIVRYHKHHRHLGVWRMSERPHLEVDPELTSSMDSLIVSFLLAEGKHRRGEK